MYRYSVDSAVTYTSEDVVLFRESPFACWMERLHLENPDHGIAPDPHSPEPGNTMSPQDDIAVSLLAQGKQVTLIDWHEPEPLRRSQTLKAMRKGVEFIVNGQLALGPLSGSANLLMRSEGYSELGNFRYIPCDTEGKTTIHSAFRLCFLADLLHGLQGQLPAQMLVIRGADLVPLTTDDHIYHYRAVKQRFMTAMREFRKHRIPDPAASSHFGRWSTCANAVLRQRAQRGEAAAEVTAPPQPQPAGFAVRLQNPIQARLATGRGLQVDNTLADQARALDVPVAPTGADMAPDDGSQVSGYQVQEAALDCFDDSDYAMPEAAPARPLSRPFSSSLHTSGDDVDA